MMSVDIPSIFFEGLHGKNPVYIYQNIRWHNLKRIRVDTFVLTSTPYKNYPRKETKKNPGKEQKEANKKENKI